jgi:acyl carrier protein phosphodiesterase
MCRVRAPHPNIRDWFTRSHPSKRENRTRNRSEIARVNGPIDCSVFFIHHLRLTSLVQPARDKEILMDKFNDIKNSKKQRDKSSITVTF